MNIKDSYLKDSFSKIGIALGYGAPFSRALEESPKVYPPYMLKIISYAEAKEDLPQTLEEIASGIENEEGMDRDVRVIIRYPIMPINVMLFLSVFLLNVLSPMYSSLFIDMSLQLPITTNFMILVSGILRNPVFLMVFVILILALNAVFYLRDVTKSAALYYLPFTGALIKKFYAYKTALWASLMLEKGMRPEEIFKSLTEGTDFAPVKKSLESITTEISAGKGFAAAAASLASFPKLFGWFQEKYAGKGDIKNSLDSCVRYIRSDVMEVWTIEGKSALSVFMLVFMGFAAIMVISIFIPLYQLIGRLG
jgi:type IV pilus assembly protein PilC